MDEGIIMNIFDRIKNWFTPKDKKKGGEESKPNNVEYAITCTNGVVAEKKYLVVIKFNAEFYTAYILGTISDVVFDRFVKSTHRTYVELSICFKGEYIKITLEFDSNNHAELLYV